MRILHRQYQQTSSATMTASELRAPISLRIRFVSAMASHMTNQSWNVPSKKFMFQNERILTWMKLLRRWWFNSQGVMLKRVVLMESSFMIALNYMISLLRRRRIISNCSCSYEYYCSLLAILKDFAVNPTMLVNLLKLIIEELQKCSQAL